MQVLGTLSNRLLSTPVLSLVIGLVSLFIARAMGLFTKRLDVNGKVCHHIPFNMARGVLLKTTPSECTSLGPRLDSDESSPQKWSSAART